MNSRRLSLGCLATLALLAACSRTDAAPRPQEPLPALEHDFGTVPHGSSPHHDFVLDLDRLDGNYAPLRAWLDCSCGRATLLWQGKDGSERAADGSPTATNTRQPGERLVARVVLDTITKDAIDIPHTSSRGHVMLQPLDARQAAGRVEWPLLVRYGIDAPVVVKPFAALDFERVPQSAQPELLTTLRGDENHPNVEFGPVECSDPALTGTLEPGPDGTSVVLRVRCRPGEPGSFRAIVRVGTNLPNDYAVHFATTWKVVPDLQAIPVAKLSFHAPADRAQTEAEAQDQFVVLVDHDRRRPAEFALHSIVADDGTDHRERFAVAFNPIGGQDRRCRLQVRCLGGLPQGFRGQLVVRAADAPTAGSTPQLLAIELVTFPAKSP